VVEHAEEQHDVERPERTQVAFHEVGDDRFDLTPERVAGAVEAALSEQACPVPISAVGSPRVVWLVAGLARVDDAFSAWLAEGGGAVPRG